MRGAVAVLALTFLLLLAGPVGATGPLPKREVTFAPDTMDVGYVRSEIFDKQREIPEQCTPRPLVVCAGPYDPDIDIQFGNTGARFVAEDANVTAGHDPARHFEYGPYYLTGLPPDAIRLCESGCSVPNSVYAYAQGNFTVYAAVAGRDFSQTWRVSPTHVGLAEPGILAPSCYLQRWYECILP